ncbi:MAG TPA: amino acid adenylation domain-containing protein [Ktedonobacteraceae bacterium]|nr:amino acid adenylation domain-containing protein [Ktedonobacteraceae bacterium]
MDQPANSPISALSLATKRALLAELLQKKAGRPQAFPLSFAQQRLWFLHQMAPANPVYNVSSAIAITGPLQKHVLERSLNELVRRHQILRTRFVVQDGQPVQQIDPPQPLPLPVADLSELDAVEREARVQHLRQQEARQPFDLSRGPLMRVQLLRLGAFDHLLLLSLHHIIADGWSLGILFHELGTLYAAFGADRPAPLPTPEFQYAHFARWQHEEQAHEAADAHLTYWKQHLADMPPLTLPADHTRSASQTFAGASEPFHLSPEITGRLKALSQRAGVTLFMTLMAGFSALLARYSGQDDIGVGTVIANRTRSELERVIGFFANTLVLRTDLAGDPTIYELLNRIRETTLEAYAHQDTPFERLVEELHPQRELSQNPLIQVVFILQNAPYEALELSGLKLHLALTPNDTSKFDLLVSVWESADGLSGSVEYSTDLFDASTIRRLLEHYKQALAAMAAQPEQRISVLPLLTAEEQEQLRNWNAMETEYPDNSCLHELVEQQAEHQPDALALVFADQHCTYGELNARANQLARVLQSLGVGPDTRVGICLERSLELAVGVLGILKAGGAYVPLDPNYPIERLAFMLTNAQVAVVVTQLALCERLPYGTHRVLCLDTDGQALAAQSSENISVRVQNHHLAYIIYTSGSTGTPKGVAMPHAALVNTFTWQQRASALAPGARTLQFASLSFDVASQEIFCTLGSGQTLVLLSENQRRDPSEMLSLVINEAIERLFLPVVVLHQFAECAVAEGVPTALREVITAGEQLQITPQVARLFEQLPDCLLCNEYGPSESHVASSFMLTGAPGTWPALPPIGRPISNLELWVLDKHFQRVPIGVPGELYIGGIGLARGYLTRPDLTAERFVPHPFSSTPGARLYKTGDLACYLPDGNLRFLGRLDHQVKLRGFRIELGEIETALSRHPAVHEVLVLTREDATLAKYLVAYVTSADDSTPLAPAELRRYLQARLPQYMLPAHFVVLERFPLTSNGKVDLHALPDPATGGADDYKPESMPCTPTEELLITIWQTLLNRDHISTTSHFFEVGGHSLLATRLIARIRQVFQVDVPLRLVFTAPVLAELARQLDAARNQDAPTLPTIQPGEYQTTAPLSFGQERLWFLDQMTPGDLVYHLPLSLHLAGDLLVPALQRALQEIVQRHAILRTTLTLRDGQPVQHIAPALALSLPLIDLTRLTGTERETLAHQVSTQEIARPFDLERGPLQRQMLVRLAPDQHILLLVWHHSISDGWSIEVFLRELGALYSALRAGEPSSLSPVMLQYADYAAWQRQQSAALTRQLAYWREHLANAPAVLHLPTDRPRPGVQTFAGASYRFQIPPTVAQGVRHLARREQATLYMTLLAAYQVLLARLSGQIDIVVGSPIAGRTRIELEEMLGFLVNTLALRVNMADNPSFRDLVRRVREVTLQAYAHQDVPFEHIVQALQPERALSHSPLFQVMFTMQNMARSTLTLPGIDCEIMPLASPVAKYDLTMALTEQDEIIHGEIEYNTDLFDVATIQRISGYYLQILEEVVRDAQQPVLTIAILTEEERQQQLMKWNATTVPYAHTRCLHELFEEQVQQRQTACAVRCGEHELTYAQLNQRANQVAHFLQAQGIGPDTLVGLCAERSLEMVVGMLSILKAGGAYVPLDPEYPAERLAFLLKDTRTPLVLTQSHLLPILPDQTVQVVCLDTGGPMLADYPSTNPHSGVSSENVAYVIYTSGSTGQPKGAMVPHAGVCNRLQWMQDTYPLTSADRVLQKTPFHFDVSVWEFFWPLLQGATLVMARPAGHRDPDYLSAVIAEQHITIVHFVPSMLHTFLESTAERNYPALKWVICSGEALGYDLQTRFFARFPNIELHNLYGPTEASIDVTAWRCERESAAQTVPIGRPIANMQTYILDAHLQLVPIGVMGELYLSGIGLARGYFRRPEITAERFLPHPFSQEAGARLYRSGDQARYRPDGTIEFLGRTDHQVKLRGFRIELGEIEQALRQHPAVRDCAVLAQEETPGNRQLVAYVVPDREQEVTGQELRNHLSSTLPAYMLPAFFMLLPALPLTSNGKLNRQALPRSEFIRTREAIVAPATALEEHLARIWQEVLGLHTVSVQDNFFEIGGHSLLLLRVATHIRARLQTEISVIDLFKYPTITTLANYLSQRQRKPTPSPTSPYDTLRERAAKQQEMIRRQQEHAQQRRVIRGPVRNHLSQ